MKLNTLNIHALGQKWAIFVEGEKPKKKVENTLERKNKWWKFKRSSQWFSVAILSSLNEWMSGKRMKFINRMKTIAWKTSEELQSGKNEAETNTQLKRSHTFAHIFIHTSVRQAKLWKIYVYVVADVYLSWNLWQQSLINKIEETTQKRIRSGETLRKIFKTIWAKHWLNGKKLKAERKYGNSQETSQMQTDSHFGRKKARQNECIER